MQQNVRRDDRFEGAGMVKMMNYDFAEAYCTLGQHRARLRTLRDMATYMRLKGIVPPTSEKSGDSEKK